LFCCPTAIDLLPVILFLLPLSFFFLFIIYCPRDIDFVMLQKLSSLSQWGGSHWPIKKMSEEKKTACRTSFIFLTLSTFTFYGQSLLGFVHSPILWPMPHWAVAADPCKKCVKKLNCPSDQLHFFYSQFSVPLLFIWTMSVRFCKFTNTMSAAAAGFRKTSPKKLICLSDQFHFSCLIYTSVLY
jgi:hypothetical protein